MVKIIALNENLLLLIAELGQLSGVAAILRFPIPDPEDEGDDAENSSDED